MITPPRFIYAAWDTDITATTANNAACFGRIVSELEYELTAPCYNTVQLAAFQLAIGACFNTDTRGGRTTFFARGQDGLMTTVEDDSAAVALAGTKDDFGNGYNFYGDYATANDNFHWFSRGTVSGQYKWLDTAIGAILIKSDLQRAKMAMMEDSQLISYDDDGFAIIRNYVQPVAERYINFGSIVAGVAIDDEQKANIINKAGGFDFISTLQNAGWYLHLPNATVQQRTARYYEGAQFYYSDGGSIQQIDMTSTTIL